MKVNGDKERVTEQSCQIQGRERHEEEINPPSLKTKSNPMPQKALLWSSEIKRKRQCKLDSGVLVK